MTDLILASKSPFRAMLMKNAGITFSSHAAHVDERAIEGPLYKSKASPEDVALVLAEAKAQDVSSRHLNSLVIGSDQTLSLNDRIFHKPKDMVEAASHLLALSGQTHQLNSAVVLVLNNETVWRHVSVAKLTMRVLSPAFIDYYLAQTKDEILSCVGAYQFEREGVQLFEKIEGDYFSIVGLPLIPLLAELRNRRAIYG